MLDGEDNIVSADWKSVSGIIHLVRSLLTFNFKQTQTLYKQCVSKLRLFYSAF